ncbi:MAG: helix-turn-helix domain-containing protein [Nitrososphaeraceae archaeon]
MASFHRSELKHLYKTEADPDVMERLLLLVMKVEGDEMILARIAKELHRSRTWASDCLAKYKKEGVEGLKDIHKIHKSSGRDPIQTTSRNSCQDKEKTKGKRTGGLDYCKAGKRDDSKRWWQSTLPSHLHPLYITSQVGL